MKLKYTIVCMVVLLIGISGSLPGQETSYRLQSDMSGGLGLSYDLWMVGGDVIMEFALPMTYIYPINSKLKLYSMTSPAFSYLHTGTGYTLGGLSDVKWGGHYLALNDMILFTFGMNLPLGKSALSIKEYSVASVITLPALNFRVPSLGQGFDFQFGINSAYDVGSNFVFGAGMSFLIKGGFNPYTDLDMSYNPGNEISIAVGVDKKFGITGDAFRLTGDIMYTIYTDDSWDNFPVFHSGNRFMIQLMSTTKINDMNLVVLLREKLKGKNKTGSGIFLLPERLNSNGNQFDIQGYLYFPPKKNMRINAVTEIKLYSNNGYGKGGTSLFGLGFGGQFKLSSHLFLNYDIRTYLGSMKTGTESSFVFGLKCFAGFQYAF